MDLTSARYGNNLINLIIRPAGRSRSFKWVGRGNLNNIPYVPRPIFIPRWIPKERPEYVAKWVPTTPGPQTNVPVQSSHQTGFGTLKTNSVVQEQHLPSYDVAPAKAPPISPAKAPAPPIVPVSSPSSQNPPASELSSYVTPHADDIIPSNNAIPTTFSSKPIPSIPYITEQPITQSNIIPDTAVRNVISSPVPQTLVDPSFSALVKDEASVDLNEFRPVDPNSIIIIEEEDLRTTGDGINIGSDIIITDDSGSNFDHSQPITLQNSAEQDLFVVNGVSNPSQFILNDGDNFRENDELLFVVDPDLNLPVTTALSDDQHLQSLHSSGGKSFDTPVLTQLVDPIQLNAVTQEKPEILLTQDITTHTSEPIFANNLDINTVSNGDILLTQDNQLNENPQFIIDSPINQIPQINVNHQTIGGSQTSQGFQANSGPHVTTDVGPNQVFESVDLIASSEQGLQPEQNSLPNDSSDIFIVNADTITPTEEIPIDQVAQFSNIQIGQNIHFHPLPIRDHGKRNGPALVAPPASPVIAAERSFSKDYSDTVGPIVPSGRSFSSEIVIPQPVPIPMGPLASLTLDFPVNGPGVRQARMDSNLLPFGTRLKPRPSRRFKSRSFIFGK